MANPFNIPERTLAQVAAAADTINVTDPANPRRSWNQPVVVRITDHADDVGTGSESWPDNTGSADDEAYLTENCALFYSCAQGHPWQKQHNVLSRTIAVGPAGVAADAGAAVIVPNFDYSTYE